MSNELYTWTVYDHPRDFPNHYVARRFAVNADGPRPTNDIMLTPTLEEMRQVLERMGLFRIPRSEQDEPQIVETWI